MVYASKKAYAKKSYKPKTKKKAAAKTSKPSLYKPKMSSKPKYGKKRSAIPTRVKSTNNVVSHSTWLSVTKILGTPPMASMHLEMAYRKSSTLCEGIHKAKA